MSKTLALLLSLPLLGCVVGDGTTAGDDGTGTGTGSGSGSGSGSGTGPTGGISGHITQNTDWTGPVLISGITTIDAGVTVTVAAGTTVTFKGQAALQIAGTLDAEGTSASKIMFKPEGAGWGGVSVNTTGQVTYKFVDQSGGNITTTGAAKLTIVDSHLHSAAGDFLIMGGGTLDMSYSTIGLDAGADTTHCNFHFNPGGNVLKVTHSNVASVAYGLMFYGGMSADFTYNNWYSNTTDVDVQTGSPVSGTFSNGYFEKGAPTGSGITATNLSTTKLVACTGANDATCAGPRP